MAHQEEQLSQSPAPTPSSCPHAGTAALDLNGAEPTSGLGSMKVGLLPPPEHGRLLTHRS